MLRSWQRKRSQGAVPGGGAIKHNWLINPFASANNAVHLKKKKKQQLQSVVNQKFPAFLRVCLMLPNFSMFSVMAVSRHVATRQTPYHKVNHLER